MSSKLIIIVVSIFFISCNEDKLEPTVLTDGTYTGFFARSSPNAKYQASDVTLVIKGDTFEGGSSIQKYPAICKGTFERIGQKIEFKNSCMWTAEFDWSYILTGEFNISSDGEKIIISRSYGKDTYDTYTLIKQ